MDTEFLHIDEIPGVGEKRAGRIPHERITLLGETFDSLAERDRWIQLRVQEQRGVISDLELHPQWELIPPMQVPGHRPFRPHRYTADFAYTKDGVRVVEDVKSDATRQERDYILNRKLMWLLKGIYVEEIRR